jgi:hypothetical protein
LWFYIKGSEEHAASVFMVEVRIVRMSCFMEYRAREHRKLGQSEPFEGEVGRRSLVLANRRSGKLGDAATQTSTI